MKKIFVTLFVAINALSFAQSWQTKTIKRIENTDKSFYLTFFDSSSAYIQKQNVSYIVTLPNTNYLQIGYMYEGSTSRIITIQKNLLTQPISISASELADTLNYWLGFPSSGSGGSQTLSISNDTLTISGGNSVILPVYIQIDSSTINSYDVLNSQNTPPVSPSTGDVYLVGTVPTGAWVGHAKDIAEWNGSVWVFTDGVQGDFLYNATNALTYIFRSGNWVQTTGIPALNNGNIISSGLKIGTNNARSLTFETNNANRGRFDSIGRFYVYDTSLRKANKYLQIDSITGRLIASDISGGGGGGVQSVVAGDNITVDDTDPQNPIISATGGGSPAGSNNQIQINQSGSFFADNTFQKSDADFNVGLDHTTQSAVSFTGSGLDDLTVGGTFSGTYPTTYTVTVVGTGTPDTFDWTDGTNSGTGVSMSTSPITLSNDIEISFGADTGHTLTDSWTWDYTSVNQNILDFSNNDYKFQSVLGTDTFGYQIGDNILGFGIKSSANTYTNVAGDFGLLGFASSNGTLGSTNQLFFSGGETASTYLAKNQYDIEVGNGTDKFLQSITPVTFSYINIIGGIEYGISQSAGAVTVGNRTGGGNNTKITIDDVTQLVTISNVPTYADDAAAATGGLTTGMLYKTTTGGITALNIVP